MPARPSLKDTIKNETENRPKPPPKDYDFLTRWLNLEENRVVLARGGHVFVDLLLNLQRSQAGSRDLTPEKLEAYNDIIELINMLQQRFAAPKP